MINNNGETFCEFWSRRWKEDRGFRISFVCGAAFFAVAFYDIVLTPAACADGTGVWDETTGWWEKPDDMVCTVWIDGTEVLFTYRSGFEPKVMPVEGMRCVKRDYDAEAKDFRDNTDLFYEQYPTSDNPHVLQKGDMLNPKVRVK